MNTSGAVLYSCFNEEVSCSDQTDLIAASTLISLAEAGFEVASCMSSS